MHDQYFTPALSTVTDDKTEPLSYSTRSYCRNSTKATLSGWLTKWTIAQLQLEQNAAAWAARSRYFRS